MKTKTLILFSKHVQARASSNQVSIRLIWNSFLVQLGKLLRKAAKIVFIAFAVIGVVLLVAGFVWIHQTRNFLERCLETKGVVIEVRWKSDSEGTLYAYPVFQFIDARTGKEITVVSTFGSTTMIYGVGQEVNILYDSQNPHNAKIESFWNIWFGPTIVIGLGSIFLSVGLIPFGFDVRKRRTVQYLKTQGEVIHGKVSNIYVDFSYSEQGEHPWCIGVQWMNPSSRKVHVFKSEHIWYDPSDFVKIEEQIEVRIDPKNPKKYWVNIEHLPRRKD